MSTNIVLNPSTTRKLNRAVALASRPTTAGEAAAADEVAWHLARKLVGMVYNQGGTLDDARQGLDDAAQWLVVDAWYDAVEATERAAYVAASVAERGA